MSEEPQVGQFNAEAIDIHPARHDDDCAISALFEAGLSEGHIRENDTGADMESIQDAYFNDDGDSNFWVACYQGNVIGMIGVQKLSDDQAEVRRLRVHEVYRRRGIGTRLMKQAITFCRDRGFLKVTLDVRIDREPAISMFEKLGFVLARARDVDGRRMLDFYIDLYREPAE